MPHTVCEIVRRNTEVTDKYIALKSAHPANSEIKAMERSRSRVDAGSNAAAGGGGVAGNYSDSYDYLFKFLVIGSAGTGKSCLLHHFIEGRFKEDSSHTIGVEFGSKIVPVGGKTVKLQVYRYHQFIIDSRETELFS